MWKREQVFHAHQRHIGLALEMLADGDAVLGDDEFFASCEVMPPVLRRYWNCFLIMP